MTAFEGPQFGVGDFVLMENITIENFMSNLKLRYGKSKMYTYIGGLFFLGTQKWDYKTADFFDEQKWWFR